MPKKERNRTDKRSIFYAETTQKGAKFIAKRKKDLDIETSVNYLKYLLIKDGCTPEDLIF